MGPAAGTSSADPVNRLILNLRAYLHLSSSARSPPDRRWDSGITVTFDTETTTDPSQRLRFGAYQVRDRGALIERGLFYGDHLAADDLATLRRAFAELEPTDAGEGLRFLSRAEFVEEIIFKWGYALGGLIIGFNLPFDLSRLATAHSYGKGSMKGGFSFTLAPGRPNVRVKHLSQRAAFIDFAGRDGFDKRPDRGFFLDVKTLAATLTSRSHSLDSLARLLGTTPKTAFDDFVGPVTPEMVRYGMNDVQATWECFDVLAKRYAAYGLEAPIEGLYSEASLGKAFLAAMNITPWRQAQPDFPPQITGQIMSAYFGGRAEVHIRREVTPVIHCDFLSMYPTVCTLMGLWRFVIADGVTWTDATTDVRDLVERCTLDDMRKLEAWRELACIVQVEPSDDVFPVRAVYPGEQTATIGLNRLTAGEPMWFTLADVLAAKFLGGKAPRIVSALRFEPAKPQAKLSAIRLEGADVRPAADDFYRLLIDQRRRVQQAEKAAAEIDKPALGSAQQSLKILANSTSYGIFVEINVERPERKRAVTLYDHRGIARTLRSDKIEKPGRYFHPLLATLITGAARLMLALAERNAIDQGLDWAFCDTDSLAIANAAGLATAEFIRRVRAVCAWFEPLNPYEAKGSILQLEKVNYPIGQDGDAAQLRPVNCLAISAKRYVLFDRADDGAPIIRKASRHGLGHLLPPYKDDRAAERTENTGVELWQEDLWKAIIAAFDAGRPDQVDLSSLRNFGQPAASRYAGTNQTLLKWFDSYNATVEPRERVWPFNFLLAFQTKSRMEMAATDSEALSLPAWTRRSPNPASRYSGNLVDDRPPVFDRKTGEPIPWEWLKSYGRSLVRHHLHSESKFLGGDDDARGALRRRHVHAWAINPIGKEADNLEEREALGEDDDAVDWGLGSAERQGILCGIEEALSTYRISDRTLTTAAGVSHHTLEKLRAGRRVSPQSVLNLAQTAEQLRKDAERDGDRDARMRMVIDQHAERLGSLAAMAVRLGVTRQYLGRVRRGERAVSDQLIQRMREALDM